MKLRNEQPKLLKLVEKQTHKMYSILEGGKHRLINLFKRRCNKKKIYIRRYVCYQCGGLIYAKYDAGIERWVLSCRCGLDTHFVTLTVNNWREI